MLQLFSNYEVTLNLHLFSLSNLTISVMYVINTAQVAALVFMNHDIFIYAALYGYTLKLFQIHQRGVQVLFAVTFTMSLSMFELIIFEILGVMDLSSRLFHWKLNLYFALVLLIVVLPMYMSYIVLNSLR